MDNSEQKTDLGIGEIKNDFDFWVDATTFIKELVNENAEQMIHEHCVKQGFNDNEKRLFREYLTKAFDMYPIMSYLKNYNK
jgi:hypothetical protein